MNKEVFLNCLEYTGVTAETSVIGLYSFSSGLSDACFNQLYSTGYNYYNGLPYDGALPLIYMGANNQTSGNFLLNNPYYINKNSGNFGVLISTNYSGCYNSSNKNQILFSSTSKIKNNSGVILGITPSNKLFFSISGYNSTISEDISPNDFVFFSLEKNRFINFGLFNLKNNSLSKKVYDNVLENLNIEKLYFGGAFEYDQYYTGYSGKLNEIYLFTGNLSDNLLNNCINCSYATGYKFNLSNDYYTGIRLTGSEWEEIKEIQIIEYQKASGNYIKTDGSSGSFYYDSGVTGEVQLYESLNPKFELIPYQSIISGIEFLFDTGKKYLHSNFNAFFDLGLFSGDIVEVYTYPDFNSNLNLEIINNQFPDSLKEVQLFGNGLAETNRVDYSVDFFKKIQGFNSDDILMYDLLTNSSATVPFLTGYISTGSYLNETFIEITGVSGIDTFGSGETTSIPFNWDIYLNGQKLIESINYSIFPHSHGENYYENHIALFRSSSDINNFNNLNDPSEFKLVPLQKNPIKSLYLISGDSFYITGLNGFSEQVWKNGIRQKIGVDYFKENVCRSEIGHYNDPNYSFKLANSQDIFFPNFIDNEFEFKNLISKYINSILSNYDTKILPTRVNSNQMFSSLVEYYDDSSKNSYILNPDFFLSNFYNQLFSVNYASDDYLIGDKDDFLIRDNVNDSTSSSIFRLHKNCVAITPRHVLMRKKIFRLKDEAAGFRGKTFDFEISKDTNIYFLNPDQSDPNNRIITRQITHKINSTIPYDPIADKTYDPLEITIGLLNEDLPNSIEPFYVLPSGYRNYIATNTGEPKIYKDLPCMAIDSLKCVYTLSTHSFDNKKIEFTFPNNETDKFNNLLKYLSFQDAGCPFFTLLDNKLVLLSISNSKELGNQGINISENINYINNKIQELNTLGGVTNNYKLKEINVNSDLFFVKKSENLNYLQDHIRDNVYNLLENIDEAAIRTEFRAPIYIYTGIPYNKRSTACILYPLSQELSCLSPSNNFPDPGHPSGRHGTLITPRHVAFASHFCIPQLGNGYTDGSTLPLNLQYELEFVAADNTIHKRKIVARKKSNIINDFTVALLDSDLPTGVSGINSCYFLPENYKDYINKTDISKYPEYTSLNKAYSSEFYVVHGSRYKEIFFLNLDNHFFDAGNISTENQVFLRYSRNLIGGDSGSPIFFIINGKLVLIGVMWTARPGWNFLSANKVQQEIYNINFKNNVNNNNYKLKTIDLSSFHKFEEETIFKKANQLFNGYYDFKNFRILSEVYVNQFYTGEYDAYFDFKPNSTNFPTLGNYEGYYTFEPKPDIDVFDGQPNFIINAYNEIDKVNVNRALQLAPDPVFADNQRISGKNGYGITLTGSFYLTDNTNEDFLPPEFGPNPKFDFNNKNNYDVSFWFYYDSSKPIEQNLFHWGTFSQNTGVGIGLTGIGNEIYPLVEFRKNFYLSGKTNNPIIKNEWNYVQLLGTRHDISLKLNNYNHEKIIPFQENLTFSGVTDYEFTLGKKVKNGNEIYSNCTFDELLIGYDITPVVYNKFPKSQTTNLGFEPFSIKNPLYVPGKFNSGINLNGEMCLTDNFSINGVKNPQINLNEERYYNISFWFYYNSSKSPNQNLFHWGSLDQSYGLSVDLQEENGEVYVFCETKSKVHGNIKGKIYYPIKKDEWNFLSYSFIYDLNQVSLNDRGQAFIGFDDKDIPGDALCFFYDQNTNIDPHEFTFGKKIKNNNIYYSDLYFDEILISYSPIIASSLTSDTLVYLLDKPISEVVQSGSLFISKNFNIN